MATVISIFQFVFSFMGLYLFSLLMHELGHAHSLSSKTGKENIHIKLKVRKGMKLLTGEEQDYDGLSHDQLIEVYMAGIVSGAMPIIIGTIFSPVYALLMVPYFYGCRSDINKIRYNQKQQRSQRD